MSQHRQHYYEANAPRQRDQARHENVGSAIALVILMVVALGASGNYLRQQAERVAALKAPATTSAVEAARIEGFRAGVTATLEAGCRTPELSQPVAK